MTGGWQDAALAARLLAADPHGLGGIRLRAAPGPVRDRWLQLLRSLLPAGTPWLRMPPAIDDERLAGGLDLAATLASGRPVVQHGLLAAAHGGIVIAAMAERLGELATSRLAAALDDGAVAIERDGLSLPVAARIAVVALDEGEGEEAIPAALAERLALSISLDGIPDRDTDEPASVAGDGAPVADDAVLAGLVETAAVLGAGSARGPLLALRTARVIAAMRGETLREGDVALAARLVLGHRATRLPPPPAEEPPPRGDSDAGDGEGGSPPLADRLIAATHAALPADVLHRIAHGWQRGASRAAGSGALQRTLTRGRPAGVRRGVPRGGARLALLDTLRAAAPWQRLRGAGGERILVIPDDLRVRRFVRRNASTTILVVDASGSAAIERLAEARGAAELLLADAYVERSEVAVLAFRGERAELLLPPTRSLTRAKRALGELPGGGGTPLAAGIEAAHRLAESVKGRARTPFVVMLTDGRANVCRDGSGGRARAHAEAMGAARRLRSAGVGSVLIDTGARPTPAAAELAKALGGRYVPLPRADARRVRDVVKTLA
jgi:magnesium chelatase subunit D